MPRRTGYQPGSPCWVDCITPDLTGTQRFYRELFGWEFTEEGIGYQLIRLGGEIIGGLGASPPGLPPAAIWTVYLATKDADTTCAQVRELGGRTVMGPVAAGEDGRLFLAVDPSGAPVGFWEGHHNVGVVLADEAGAVCDFELRTPWPERAEQFYGGLFGYTLGAPNRHETLDLAGEQDPHETLDLGGVPQARLTRIGLGEHPHWLPHFGVPGAAEALDTSETLDASEVPDASEASDASVQDAVARAVALGAQVLHAVPHGPTLLRDPAGAVFALGPVGVAAVTGS